jgi:small subunit ribosomal protein S20
MPNKQSAERRVRIAERNRLRNRYWTTRCKNAVKKVLGAVTAKDSELVTASFNIAQSVIDKAVVKGVMHRNTAARRKKMMARRIKTLSESAV